MKVNSNSGFCFALEIPVRLSLLREAAAMMRRQLGMQPSLYYQFNPEGHLPEATANRSIDPELTIRLLLAGYIVGKKRGFSTPADLLYAIYNRRLIKLNKRDVILHETATERMYSVRFFS